MSVAVVMVQREVAQRIVAKPGSKVTERLVSISLLCSLR